jgi:cytochrome c peroxidase
MAALVAALVASTVPGCMRPLARWEKANPLRPIPDSPLGIDSRLGELNRPPTPQRVRLGRWLFYDTRLSLDASVSCATCHQPEHAFSEPTPTSTGIHGLKGSRKAPALVNLAFALSPHLFWDGRADSLEAQTLVPIANPVEMGSTPEGTVQTLKTVVGYRPYFQEAFGTEEITAERVGQAIADYERTRLSGNSPWDRWRRRREPDAVSALVKAGDEMFFGKAGCGQCHLGDVLSDGLFHNVGVGWDAAAGRFADEGRFRVTGRPADLGAFKTPGLREVARHAPYMHDGSVATLEAVVELYDRGGTPNPQLSPKIRRLHLSADEKRALVAFLRALDGEGFQDEPPSAFPQ